MVNPQVFIFLIVAIHMASGGQRAGGGGEDRLKMLMVVTSFLLVLATCLLLCLNLFVAQVHWHTRDAMESDLLWTYYLNWCSDIFYMFAGESLPCCMLEGWIGKSLLEREV